jgi:hypothetical protein
MTLSEQLWRTGDRARWFIIPDADQPRLGALPIRSLAGDDANVDPDWLRRYEVLEAEGRAWAKEEFGYALDEIRRRVDAKLAATREHIDETKRTPVAADSPITPEAIPAIFALVKTLPRLIADSLSGEPARILDADSKMAELHKRLNEAGIGIDHRLVDFPNRLASLRKEFEARRAAENPDTPR